MSLTVESREGVCELRLDSPPGNILDSATCRRIEEEVRTRGPDPHLRAFLISAAGRHFSYGASIEEHRKDEVENFLPSFHSLFLALAETDVPVVAAVRGLCLGGGFELVAFAHFILAEENARFAVPEITLAVFPPAACVFLPWKLGSGPAEDLILSGRQMDAAEAERRGFVSRLCPEGTLEEKVEAFLDSEIRPRSAIALRLAARAARGPLHRTLESRFHALERLYLDDLMSTHDAVEGIEAFLAKRPPEWTDA